MVKIEVLLGKELQQTDTSWAPSKPDQPYYVYWLEPIRLVSFKDPLTGQPVNDLEFIVEADVESS